MLRIKRQVLVEAKTHLQAFQQLASQPEDTALSCDTARAFLEAARDELGEECSFPWVHEGAFFVAMGFPEGTDIYEVDWTAGLLRRCCAILAERWEMTVDRLTEQTGRGLSEGLDQITIFVKNLAAKVKRLRRERKALVDRAKALRTLPETDAAEKVLRYETTLNRQLFQTLHELERLQAARAGQPVPLPLAVDVGLDISAPGGQVAAG